MELVANVWPVIDSGTGMVQRFFVRAYAMDASDEVIGATLLALAASDFRMAQVFLIPSRFIVEWGGGSLPGCVPIGLFHEQLQVLLEPAYRELERGFAELQGINASAPTPQSVQVIPRFPDDPYTVTTSIIETEQGQLLPQIKAS